jgi:hypothetical protein
VFFLYGAGIKNQIRPKNALYQFYRKPEIWLVFGTKFNFWNLKNKKPSGFFLFIDQFLGENFQWKSFFSFSSGFPVHHSIFIIYDFSEFDFLIVINRFLLNWRNWSRPIFMFSRKWTGFPNIWIHEHGSTWQSFFVIIGLPRSGFSGIGLVSMTSLQQHYNSLRWCLVQKYSGTERLDSIFYSFGWNGAERRDST